MDENAFINMSIEQRREYCRNKIAEHSPPATPHDEFMIKVYEGLLELHEDQPEPPITHQGVCSNKDGKPD